MRVHWFLILLIVGGCSAGPLNPVEPYTNSVGKESAQIDALAWAGKKSLDENFALVAESLKPIVKHASWAFGEIRGLAESQGENLVLANAAAEKLVREKKAIEESLSYRVGRFLVRAALWIVGIWTGLGILAVVLGLGNPLTGAASAGKGIMRLLPFANPFGWVKDWLLKRQAVPVVAISPKIMRRGK